MPPLILSGIISFFANLLIGLFVLLKNPRNKSNILFFLFSLTVSGWSVGSFLENAIANKSIALNVLRFNYMFGVWLPPIYIHFVYSFTPLTSTRKKILSAAYLISALLSTTVFTSLFIRGLRPLQVEPYLFLISSPGPIYFVFFAFFGLTVFEVLRTTLVEMRHSSGFRYLQFKYLTIANAIATGAGLEYFSRVFGLLKSPPLDDYILAFYLLFLAYAIVRYRLMDIGLAITRTAVFIVVYAAVLGFPLAGALTWQTQLQEILGHRWWVWVLLSYAGLATAAHYANLYFQKRAEERLMAEQRRYQAVLREAAQGMTLIKDLQKLLNLIVHLLTQKVRIRHASVFLWDEDLKLFANKVSRQWKVINPPSFARQSPLMEYLHWHRGAVVTEEMQMQVKAGSKELLPVVDALGSLDSAVVIPSFTEHRCEGFLVLGEKFSGSLFSHDDLQVFEVLASQAALAIENAQFYEELKRTQTDLFQTAKMASLGHMAGGMSHQINNRFHVLTILAGTIKSVMKDQDPATMDKERLKLLWDKALESLSKIEDNALRGGDIVKTLLRFSRPSGGYKPVTVRQIVDTAREVVQFRVNMSSLDFIEEIPEDLPPIRGDLNQLADCCFNLMSNAYDAIQKKASNSIDEQAASTAPDAKPAFRGRMSLRAYSEQKEGHPWVVIEFQDNGTGMTSTELENLFVPFFTTKATAQKGTGLGLYVIQRIVERHGGTISASSKYGKGTSFTLRLPVFQQEKHESGEGSEQQAAA